MLSLFSTLEGVDKSFFNEAKNGKLLSLLKDDNVHHMWFCNNDDRKYFDSRSEAIANFTEASKVCSTSARSPRFLRSLFEVSPSFIQDSFFSSPTRSRAHPFSIPFSAAVRPSNQTIRCHFPSAGYTSPCCRINVSFAKITRTISNQLDINDSTSVNY